MLRPIHPDLTFASNVFVDPSTMPGWLQTFVDLNPITHLVTAVRGPQPGSTLIVLAVTVRFPHFELAFRTWRRAFSGFFGLF